jgi:glycosyltransferase involved in cell wall biosynthesis
MLPKKIVMLQSTLGHYHYPRLAALAKFCPTEGFTFENIELSGSEMAYPWFQTKTQDQFANYCLFPGDQLESIPETKLWSAIKDQLEKSNPNVLFILGYSLGVMRKSRYWCETKKIATVLMSDSNHFDKKRYKLFEYLKYMFVHKFDAAFVAGTSSSIYMQHLGIPQDRIAYGCDVVDVQAISAQALAHQESIDPIQKKYNLPPKYFLFVGRLIPEKNVPGLLCAFEKFMNGDTALDAWHLVICGSGSEEERVKSLIQKLPPAQQARIHLLGFVDPTGVIELLSGASCLILPSISEPWGLVVNEAMACGLPVIVSQKAGASFDLVRNAENGWTIDPFDTEQISKVLSAAASLDEPARQKLGCRGREIIGHWDLDRYSRGVVESSRMALAHVQNKYKG